MITQFKVFMAPDAAKAASKVLESGYIGQGPLVDEFENILKQKLGFEYGVTVNSGTSALQLALSLCDIGPGDDVVSTPMTCLATNMAIKNTGANIVWADVDAHGNISPQSVFESITPRTKAVMAVDWGGLPCDYPNLRFSIEHAPRKGYKYVPIIEDAAHSILSTINGKTINQVGGDYVCYSFQAIKHLTTVDGGLCVVPDFHYEKAKMLRWFALDRTQSDAMRCYQDAKMSGFKYHMNDVNAAIGISNIAHLEEIVKSHREHATYYDKVFAGKLTPEWPSNRYSSFWLYTIHVKNPIRFQKFMVEKEIGVSQTHNRNDKATVFVDSINERFPLVELDRFFKTMTCIPVGWWLKENELEYIANCVLEYGNKYGFQQN